MAKSGLILRATTESADPSAQADLIAKGLVDLLHSPDLLVEHAQRHAALLVVSQVSKISTEDRMNRFVQQRLSAAQPNGAAIHWPAKVSPPLRARYEAALVALADEQRASQYKQWHSMVGDTGVLHLTLPSTILGSLPSKIGWFKNRLRRKTNTDGLTAIRNLREMIEHLERSDERVAELTKQDLSAFGAYKRAWSSFGTITRGNELIPVQCLTLTSAPEIIPAKTSIQAGQPILNRQFWLNPLLLGLYGLLAAGLGVISWQMIHAKKTPTTLVQETPMPEWEWPVNFSGPGATPSAIQALAPEFKRLQDALHDNPDDPLLRWTSLANFRKMTSSVVLFDGPNSPMAEPIILSVDMNVTKNPSSGNPRNSDVHASMLSPRLEMRPVFVVTLANQIHQLESLAATQRRNSMNLRLPAPVRTIQVIQAIDNERVVRQLRALWRALLAQAARTFEMTQTQYSRYQDKEYASRIVMEQNASGFFTTGNFDTLVIPAVSKLVDAEQLPMQAFFKELRDSGLTSADVSRLRHEQLPLTSTLFNNFWDSVPLPIAQLLSANEFRVHVAQYMIPPAAVTGSGAHQTVVPSSGLSGSTQIIVFDFFKEERRRKRVVLNSNGRFDPAPGQSEQLANDLTQHLTVAPAVPGPQWPAHIRVIVEKAWPPAYQVTYAGASMQVPRVSHHVANLFTPSTLMQGALSTISMTDLPSMDKDTFNRTKAVRYTFDRADPLSSARIYFTVSNESSANAVLGPSLVVLLSGQKETFDLTLPEQFRTAVNAQGGETRTIHTLVSTGRDPQLPNITDVTPLYQGRPARVHLSRVQALSADSIATNHFVGAHLFEVDGKPTWKTIALRRFWMLTLVTPIHEGGHLLGAFVRGFFIKDQPRFWAGFREIFFEGTVHGIQGSAVLMGALATFLIVPLTSVGVALLSYFSDSPGLHAASIGLAILSAIHIGASLLELELGDELKPHTKQFFGSSAAGIIPLGLVIELISLFNLGPLLFFLPLNQTIVRTFMSWWAPFYFGFIYLLMRIIFNRMRFNRFLWAEVAIVSLIQSTVPWFGLGSSFIKTSTMVITIFLLSIVRSFASKSAVLKEADYERPWFWRAKMGRRDFLGLAAAFAAAGGIAEQGSKALNRKLIVKPATFELLRKGMEFEFQSDSPGRLSIEVRNTPTKDGLSITVTAGDASNVQSIVVSSGKTLVQLPPYQSLLVYTPGSKIEFVFHFLPILGGVNSFSIGPLKVLEEKSKPASPQAIASAA